jgi:hypothetical protein
MAYLLTCQWPVYLPVDSLFTQLSAAYLLTGQQCINLPVNSQFIFLTMTCVHLPVKYNPGLNIEVLTKG